MSLNLGVMVVSNGALTFLAGSENRVEVLMLLRDDGPFEQRGIVDAVDASKRTVKRSLDSLEDHGWVSASDRRKEYRITALGELVLDAYTDVVDRLSVADRLGPFLERVPADALDIDPLALVDAEVVTRGDNQPYAPMDRVLEVRRDASHIREVVDIIQADSVGQLRERVESGDLEADVVLEAGVLDAVAENDGYADQFEAALAADDVTFHVFDGSLSFVFGVMDDVVVLGVTDNQGLPEAVIISDDPTVRQWATARFESYRDRGRRLTPEQTPPAED